jgi:hypothetical protein
LGHFVSHLTLQGCGHAISYLTGQGFGHFVSHFTGQGFGHFVSHLTGQGAGQDTVFGHLLHLSHNPPKAVEASAMTVIQPTTCLIIMLLPFWSRFLDSGRSSKRVRFDAHC